MQFFGVAGKGHRRTRLILGLPDVKAGGSAATVVSFRDGDENGRGQMLAETAKRQMFPELEPDERSVLERPGACKAGPRDGWKDGHLFLTEKRFLFAHEGRFVLTIPYGVIKNMCLKRGFLGFRRRRVLALTCGSNNGAGLARVWLSVSNAESLAEWLCSTASHLLHEETVHQVVSHLGVDGKFLIEHLSRKRHATTEELARILAKPARNVPPSVEGEVNETARHTTGCDLVVFRESWFDAQAGEWVRNSWWLSCPFQPAIDHHGRAV